MFKYKLEPILSLKEKIEESKKRELGIANQVYESAQIDKHTLVTKKQVACKETMAENSETINVVHLQQFNYYMNYLQHAIVSKEEEIEVAALRVEEKRNELVEAVKERKILENLKEIKSEEYRQEENRRENRIVDEIVTYKYRTHMRG